MKMSITHFLLICTLICLFSCTRAPYVGSDQVGADELVMDSYKIRQGKFSILQLEGKEFIELSPELLSEYVDVIQDGDVLSVAVFHPTRSDIAAAVASLSQTIGFRVQDGKVRLPDLEPITVANLTLEQATQKIQDAYSGEIRDVQIFLSYRDRLERKVELAGLVSLPTIPVDGKIRLFEILSKAKVPTQANLFKSYMVRENEMVPVDLYKLLKEGDMSQNIVMRGGDKIYIADPSASTLMVLGEVGKEKLVDVPNGFMTIRQALSRCRRHSIHGKQIVYPGDPRQYHEPQNLYADMGSCDPPSVRQFASDARRYCLCRGHSDHAMEPIHVATSSNFC